MRSPAPIRNGLNAGGPITDKNWQEYFAGFYAWYDQVGRWTDPYAPGYGKAEPAAKYRIEGLMAYANGVDWNPGAGEGIYRRDGAAWTRVG